LTTPHRFMDVANIGVTAMVFNTTFYNISSLSRHSVLLVMVDH